ncbi:MAG: anhydro-N-acetylmuramic acid kinase, partial [Candidatus Zixiibacteriota bacterium]
MNLSKLLNRKSITVIGLNSGTSVDGLDLAAIRVNKRFASPAYKYLIGLEKKFPSPLRQMTLSVADSPRATINEMMSLDSQLGQFFGRSAASFMKKLSRAGIKVDLISSHGQTIRHLPLPAPAWTVQAGSLDRIAALTGKIVIGDFRQADIALGGEGAPITTGAVSALLSHSTESRLIVNIGGISNFFYLPSSRNPAKIAAGDCGPGNSLCDLLAQRLFSQKFDRGGRIARAGEISKRLLTLLMGHPWFRQANKSTGRESFGPSMADRLIRRGKSLGLSDRDLMTTAAELTACSIALSVWKYLRSDEKMINLYFT